MKYKLEIYKAKNKQWSWRIKARNGRIVAVAGETYKKLMTMMRIYRNLRDAMRKFNVILAEPD